MHLLHLLSGLMIAGSLSLNAGEFTLHSNDYLLLREMIFTDNSLALSLLT